MKPFNLEKALAGAPVVTRDGRKVKQLMLFKTLDIFCLGGVMDGKLHYWTRRGKWTWVDYSVDANDLFMAEPKASIWSRIFAKVKEAQK